MIKVSIMFCSYLFPIYAVVYILFLFISSIQLTFCYSPDRLSDGCSTENSSMYPIWVKVCVDTCIFPRYI